MTNELAGPVGQWRQEVAGGVHVRGQSSGPPIAVLFQIPPAAGSGSSVDLGGDHRVEVPRRIKSRPPNYLRPDMLIVDDLMTTLAYSPTVDCSRVEITCENGKVVASGALRSRQDRPLLEEMAASTLGVIDYRDETEISKGVRPPADDEVDEGDGGVAAATNEHPPA